MIQRSAGPAETGAGPRCNAGCSRRRTRCRSCSPSSRYRHRTRLRLTGQPSRRIKTQIRLKPNRGRAIASSRMRSRRADWSFAVLERYHAARLKLANAHARRTGTPNVCISQSASSRRCVGLRLFLERRGQHVLVVSEIRDQRLESLVLVHELVHAAHFGHAQVREMLLVVSNGERNRSSVGGLHRES